MYRSGRGFGRGRGSDAGGWGKKPLDQLTKPGLDLVGKKLIAQLQQENAALRADKQADMMKVQIDATKAKTDAYKAETERGTKLAELGVPLAVIERFMTPMSILDEAAQPQPPAPQQPMQRPPMPNGGQPF